MDIMNFDYATIKKVVEQKGYKFFEGLYNLNFIGVRHSDFITNMWDDAFYALWQQRTSKGLLVNKVMRIKDFTTDPGLFYSQEKLLNDDGVAILAPGQHRGMWRKGRHRGKYDAFVQNKKVIVFRDDDLDGVMDYDVEDYGRFGINMHHGYDAKLIGKMSAGCQVFRYKKDLKKVLDLFNRAQGYNGTTVSYTLLEAHDFAA